MSDRPSDTGYDQEMHSSASHASPPYPPPGYRDREEAFDPRYKSPRSAVFLSVVPGLGQFYVGYYVRSFVILATVLLFMALASSTRTLEAVGVFGMFFTWIYNLVDAGRVAALYNHAVAGGKVIDLPEDFKMPSMGGSIVGGAILVTFGAIALSNTLFGYSLRWLDDWWPVFPLALGVYLLARGIQDHARQRQRAGIASEPTPAGSE